MLSRKSTLKPIVLSIGLLWGNLAQTALPISGVTPSPELLNITSFTVGSTVPASPVTAGNSSGLGGGLTPITSSICNSAGWMCSSVATDAGFIQRTITSGTETYVQSVVQADPSVPATAPTPTIDSVCPALSISAGISAANHVPHIRLCTEQNGVKTRTVTSDGGVLKVHALVVGAGVNDIHRFDWGMSDNVLVDTDGNLTDNVFTIDPINLPDGVYKTHVSVTNSGVPSQTSQVDMRFRVDTNPLTLSNTLDSDGDGIVDATEGYGDKNGNGIPDYLDAITQDNLLPTDVRIKENSQLSANAGSSIRVGSTAFSASVLGAGITQKNIDDFSPAGVGVATVDTLQNIGGFFDFVVATNPSNGSHASVVIPQQAPIPANPVYRKLMATGWQDFVEDADNQLRSATGSKGVCPPVGDTRYSPALTSGDWCVELTIADGGPNDADGQVNGEVADPGGVANVTPAINSAASTISTTTSAGTNNGSTPDTGGGFLGPWALFSLFGALCAVGYRRLFNSRTG